jgi:transcriptional regulator with XRE-family HTH domain
MDWNEIMAANVRRIRTERKLTQEQLAHDSGIDVTYLRGIEAGRRNPSVAVIGRLASTLLVKPAALFQDPAEI